MDQEPKVQKKKRGKISYKRLASLTSLGTFLIMTITGIILYFTPEGRVAYWVKMVEEKFTGTGIGQKTLPWFLEDIGLNPAVARAKLAANDIEIGDDETLKKAADRYGTEPIEILKVILVNGYTVPHP